MSESLLVCLEYITERICMSLEKFLSRLEQKTGVELLDSPQTGDNCVHLGEMGQLGGEVRSVFQLNFTNKVRSKAVLLTN